MQVLFTQQSQRQLEAALAPRLARLFGVTPLTPEAAKEQTRAIRDRTLGQLRRILEATFGATDEAVVVHKLMNGFRRKDDFFILLVEVFAADGPATYVVKICSDQDAKRELASWESCRPVGLSHDLVLLPLRSGVSRPIDGFSSIVYGAAQQLIGVEQVHSLEEAAIQSVFHGSPTLTSIDSVLSDLYERFGHLLYVHSVDECATDDPGTFVFDIPKLSESIRLWGEEPLLSLRSLIVSTLQECIGPSRFADPVDYLNYIRAFVPWRDEDDTIKPAKHQTAITTNIGVPMPRPQQAVPCLMRGRAHGDLHGRNVLVGTVHGRALWPTVFDYENMGPRNFIGWDFVKLETELKIRVYPRLFCVPLTKADEGGRSARLFAEEVQTFEQQLSARTEWCRENDDWPSIRDTGTSPDNRLHWLLLRLRRRAHWHLGVDLGRPRLWLEEYYFLLMCYGVCSARFDNLQDKERTAAFVSAGVACARLSWYRDFTSRQTSSPEKRP